VRSSLTFLTVWLLVASLGIAQDSEAKQDDVATLISALASKNPAPTRRRGPDLEYPPKYDRKKQEPVQSALSKLQELGPQAFESLIASWGDEWYCLTYSVGINGYMYNATVGKMCRVIVYDQIQPYGIWPRTEDDPRGKPKRPSYPSTFLFDAKMADQWVKEHKAKSLFEIQLMVVDWVIEEEAKRPGDFTAEEHQHMQNIRDQLLKTKKTMTRGNYYMDDYD
jgi:hypothetical protein